jgi:predicted DNA-binding transcriptional regulator AlpA
MDKYINKMELVKALGISTRTLENWIALRNFPSARRVTGSRLAFYCVAEVEAWFERELSLGGEA